jgi:hypothetical protein
VERRQRIITKPLQQTEDLALLVCFFALLLVETRYIAWLERLPAFPLPPEPESPFLHLPPWYGRPRVEVTFLLTVAGGMLARTAMSLIAFFRSKHLSADTVHAHRTAVIHRLKTTAFWAALTGAELFFVQFFRR